ncbi:molybdopterin molybdotransferase MoeA [Skermania sp. ID1734]|uniref:molybdopterin molybdotransferase MoeA n=1 Tax=Skermania sp. ID1734 TaxID=2597516 RepID=UPI00117DBF86|nr:gephyrin-like molybdotransferase Glp [Skermania sp. ID1734]TSE00968.1 molybdopterin molybdotransferase MoeA [Skermania sp. ID1734]
MTRRTVDEQISKVTALLQPIGAQPAERVPLREALGRLLATDVVAPIDLPLFRNSQMDGFAVHAVDLGAIPATLPIVGTIAAGDTGATPLPPRSAVRIMTGAPLPDGADCVVPVEDTAVDGEKVTIHRRRTAGEFVREPGSDVAAGANLVDANTLLRVRHLAALAAVGIQTVDVRRRLRVAVITTGNELIPAGEPLRPGQIYDSNGLALAASVAANGAEVVSVGHSSDDPAEFLVVLTAAAAAADLVLTSGGVSMGDFEVVKETLQPRGGDFAHVAMQPGGPQGISNFDGVPVLSLPGNPVSTLVSFEIFLRPFLRAAAGLAARKTCELPTQRRITSIPGRRQFLRGRTTDLGVEQVSGPGSHLVAAMVTADVLIDIGEDTVEIPAGECVRVLQL